MTMRTISKKRNRSGNAECEICGTPTILEVHHIEGRDIPNHNKSSNLCSICGTCHNEIHAGLIILEGWAMTGSGYELLSHEPDEAPLMKDAIVHTF